MTAGEHDTLVYRLSQTLVKLNQGEKLSLQSLADEYGVNIRTIQRDLNVRFAYLPLQKSNGFYSLDPIFLGKLSSKDIERFASLAGVNGLFPSLNDDFLKEIFDKAAEPALLVKGHSYEDLSGKSINFNLIKSVISSKHKLSFKYQKTDELKTYNEVSPYKLMNHHGIWYLVAVESDKIKTFVFNKIKNIVKLDSIIEYDPTVENRLRDEDGFVYAEFPYEDDIEVLYIYLAAFKYMLDYFSQSKGVALSEEEYLRILCKIEELLLMTEDDEYIYPECIEALGEQEIVKDLVNKEKKGGCQ